MIKAVVWLIVLLALVGFPQPAMAVVLMVLVGGWFLKLLTSSSARKGS